MLSALYFGNIILNPSGSSTHFHSWKMCEPKKIIIVLENDSKNRRCPFRFWELRPSAYEHWTMSGSITGQFAREVTIHNSQSKWKRQREVIYM